MIRPGIHPQGVIPQPFLTQQHGQSTPSQPHNLNLLPGSNQGMNFLPNAHSPNGSFPHPNLAHVRAEHRRRVMHDQSQRATGGAQTGPSGVNGVIPALPSGVGYPGMAPQNGQGQVHRVVSQPVNVGGPLPNSHPPSHPANINNPGMGLTSGLQTRPGPQSQSQPQIGIRPGQPPLPGQPSVSQIRPPPVPIGPFPPGGGPRGSGVGVNMASSIGNVPQQTQPQPGFPSALGMGGPGSQPPPQGPQATPNPMTQSAHRTIPTPDGTNSFGGMPGFTGAPFPQAGSHPPAGHIGGPNSANQFSFMPSSSSPSQPMDMGHGLSSSGAGPSSTSPTRDFTLTPAQVAASLQQYGPGAPSGSGGGGSTNEGFPPTFTTMPPQRPSSSSHSALGLAHQQGQPSQGLSYPTPPRQQTPLQPPQMSQAAHHLGDRLGGPIANPTRPQSQPQRPSSQQQVRQSLTPRIQPGTLPPNATLLQGHPASMSGGSAHPPQPRTIMGTGVGAGPPPLATTLSAESGDLSRQPVVTGIRPSMQRFVYNQSFRRICSSHHAALQWSCSNSWVWPSSNPNFAVQRCTRS